MSTTGSPPVRLPSGVSTSPLGYVFGNYPSPTPPRLFEYFNDFATYNAGDWLVTATGGGTSALNPANGGQLLVSTAGGNNDVQGNELAAACFEFTPGSQVWFSISFNLSVVTTSAFMAGLSNTFAALAPTDGVYFSKVTGSAVVNAVIRAASTSTTIALGTLVASTQAVLSFYYDGKPTPTLYFFSTIGYSGAPTAFSVPYFSGGNQVVASASSEAGATNTLANLPGSTTLLTAGFALKATTAAVKAAAVDYMLASEEIIARF